MNCQQAGHAGAAREDLSHPVAGGFRSNHGDVDVLRGSDGPIVDVEAVGEHQGLPCTEVRCDLLLVDIGLEVVGDEHHDDVRLLSRLINGADAQSFGLGLLTALAPLVEAYHDVQAVVPAIEGVGVSLAAVSDYADGLVLQEGQVGVVVVVHLCWHFLSYAPFCWYLLFQRPPLLVSPPAGERWEVTLVSHRESWKVILVSGGGELRLSFPLRGKD